MQRSFTADEFLPQALRNKKTQHTLEIKNRRATGSGHHFSSEEGRIPGPPFGLTLHWMHDKRCGELPLQWLVRHKSCLMGK